MKSRVSSGSKQKGKGRCEAKNHGRVLSVLARTLAFILSEMQTIEILSRGVL